MTAWCSPAALMPVFVDLFCQERAALIKELKHKKDSLQFDVTEGVNCHPLKAQHWFCILEHLSSIVFQNYWLESIIPSIFTFLNEYNTSNSLWRLLMRNNFFHQSVPVATHKQKHFWSCQITSRLKNNCCPLREITSPSPPLYFWVSWSLWVSEESLLACF